MSYGVLISNFVLSNTHSLHITSVVIMRHAIIQSVTGQAQFDPTPIHVQLLFNFYIYIFTTQKYYLCSIL